MIHPHTELRFISDEIGYGVVATKFIPKGTITWALDKLDRTFEPSQFNAFDKIYRDILEKYCYRDNKGRYVLCWDISRYVNHSFKSNCISTAYEFEIAIRDIYPGEELTDDYGYLNVTEPFECLKENGSSRTAVFPDDLLNFHKEWDAQLIDAFAFLKQVDQPLSQVLSQETLEKAFLISERKIEMDSILNCYYKGDKQKSLNKKY